MFEDCRVDGAPNWIARSLAYTANPTDADYLGQRFGKWAMAAEHCLATLCDLAHRTSARRGQTLKH
eukprot:9469629-Pyramimonas_sp.AAC.1